MHRLARSPVDMRFGWELEDLWGYVALPSTGLADFEAVAHHVAGSGLSTLTQWGGNWALRARHKPTGTLALVTDACATVPHYWLRATGRIHSDPNLEALVENVGGLAVDRAFVEQSLNLVVVSGRSVFTDVCSVPPGTITFVRPDGSWAEHRYFQPETIRQRHLPADRTVDLMARTVDTAVRDAVAGQSVAAHVSGGLDSGVVTAMAARYTDIVAGYSWVPPSPVDRESVEYRRVRLASQSLELAPDYSDPTAPEGRWLREVDPLLYPYWGYLTYESVTLPRAKAAGVTVILSGWGGDDFASSAVRRPELFILSGRWGHWWQHASHRSATRSLRSTLSNTEILRIGRPRRPPRLAARTSQVLAVRQGIPSMRTATWWLAAHRFGVSYRYPLLDPRVISLACTMPVTYFSAMGETRWGFRRVAERYFSKESVSGNLKPEPERVSLLENADPRSAQVDRIAEVYPELLGIYRAWEASD